MKDLIKAFKAFKELLNAFLGVPLHNIGIGVCNIKHNHELLHNSVCYSPFLLPLVKVIKID